MTPLLQLHEVILRHPEKQFRHPLNWSLIPGENWAFLGPNGSGKTLFVDLLCGKLAIRSGTLSYPLLETSRLRITDVIKAMAFRDIYSLSGDYDNFSYQQRWNSQDAEVSPRISDLLKLHQDSDYSNLILDLFGVRSLLDRKLIHLSSGELRKFLLVRTLMTKPKVLILDNPFIGLDAYSRELLNHVLENLAKVNRLQLILVLSNPSDIPNFIRRVLPFSDMVLGDPVNTVSLSCMQLFHDSEVKTVERKYETFTSEDFDIMRTEDRPGVVQLRQVSIKYDQRNILKNLNWTIQKGERWALLGPNGAGKSTLLSLICADNPQSYANDVRLFGKKRGTGESIWDIKRHIGYVSPEMHHYYQKNIPCRDIVGSGLFDTIGLYRKCNEEQLVQCRKWMKIFGIHKLEEKSFRNVSSGEQRLCLLARAFVKEPALLILDEPLHGLDVSNKLLAKSIIEEYMLDSEKTLIYVTHYQHEIPGCVEKHFFLSHNMK